MENSTHDTDTNINAQLTDKLFIKSDYSFQLDSTKNKFDHIVDDALTITKINELFSSKFNRFALTFLFLTPIEPDNNCSYEIMLTTKLTHTYT